MKHEIEFIIKSNEYLAENKIKNGIEQLFLKYKYANNIHQHKKNKTNELQPGIMNLNHQMVFILFQIFKIVLKTSLKSTKTVPPIKVYINRINNRLVFKIKDVYKLELQTPEQ